jgi:preprotein translocase subunit SecF
MLNIMRYYKFWFAVSAVLFVASVAALSAYGLNLGIDFKGGTITQARLEVDPIPAAADVKAALADAGYGDAVVQQAGERSYLIRTQPQEKEQHDLLMSALEARYGTVVEESYSSIGPVIGKELAGRAFYQLGLVSLGIILYIAYAFRKVTRPMSSWRFGWAAIIALVHDLFIVVGVFAVLGRFKGVEIDTLFVTALLTILGFSVHDTIVVFDRIRENVRVRAGQGLREIINSSIAQTVVRSINTSLTVIFMLTALLLFGGESTRYFVLALLIGMVAGTYSSIFIASPILLAWHNLDVWRKSRE